jgi:hypothetical protein
MNILYPVFAMSGLTLFCIGRLGYLRYHAVRAGEVDPRFFSLYRGFEEPDRLAVHSRHVINHFETPLLFYRGCVIAYVTDQQGPLAIGLAWAYVGLRYIHSYVHLTRNIVIIRFRMFLLSMAVLTVLWLTILTGTIRL